jgi:hypothetical protein
VVVVRHPNTFDQATTTGSPTVTDTGTHFVYVFTGNGTITFN